MENRLHQKNIVSINDLCRLDLELIVETASNLKSMPGSQLLAGQLVASCFFEPSTRTRLSFEAAVSRLGGAVIGFSDADSTSATKGETLADTIRVISSYADALIIRHPQEGAARLAAEFSSVPVINAGDGSNQHPTQTLLDLFTIRECQGTLDGLTVSFVGDLKYGRTVHSLVQALSLFGARFNFLAPDALMMPDALLEELDARDVHYHRADSIDELVECSDILYMTRVQKERFDETEYKHIASRYILDSTALEWAKDNLKVLHPLPRVNEIPNEIDRTPYAHYFQQAENGVYARQALLALVLNESPLGG